MKSTFLLKTILFAGLILTACTPNGQTPTPSEATNPPANENTPIGEVTAPSETHTPQPEGENAGAPRALTICMGAEPESLYLYGSSMHAQSNILEAIYDGPIDQNSFGYQPVILEKLPNLADGDAVLQSVTVQEGDLIVDADGNVTTLAAGLPVRPAGCQTSACAIPFAGGEIQMDQLSSTFTLLEGITWSDGQPLTARDSVYSFQLDSDPDTPTAKFRIERTASYTALDERTVQWVGLPGYLNQTYFTNFWTPLPRHVWGSTSAADLIEAEISRARPMGWGPYVITQWIIGQSIRLKKNPNYFRTAEGLPTFDNLIFRFTGSNETITNRVLSGECDVLDIEAAQDIPFDELIRLDQSGQLQAYFTTGTVWEHADFGMVPAAYDDGYQLGVDRPDFFGDVRIRRAIALCMDRQKIVDTILFGLAEVPSTYLPSTHPLYNPNAPQYAFDPAVGMALLDQVGWRDTDGNPNTPGRIAQGVPNVPDGTPLSFDYRTTPSSHRQQAAQILTSSLAQCGIQALMQTSEATDFFADGPDGPLFGRRFDMAQFAWLTGVTPPCDLYLTQQIPGEDVARFPYRWGGQNLTGYSNPAFDAACQNALSILPGQPGYEEAHRLAQQIFAEDLPVIPLYSRLWVTATRSDFCGHIMDPTADSDFWNIEAYDDGEACLGG